MRADPVTVVPYLRAQLSRLGIQAEDEGLLVEIVRAQRERTRTLVEMARSSQFFFGDTVAIDSKAAQKHLAADGREVLQAVRRRLEALPDWGAESLSGVLNALSQQLGLGLGKIAQPLRVAVSGGTVSPPIDLTLQLLGRSRTLSRIDAALAAPLA